MKSVLTIFLLVCSAANASKPMRFSCLGGNGLVGSEMTIVLGTWSAPGSVKFKNSFSDEFEWTGAESHVGTNNVLAELEPVGSLAAISGGEYLKGAHKFVPLTTQHETTAGLQVNRIFIEEGVLDGRSQSGLVVYIQSTRANSKTESAAEVVACESLTIKGERRSDEDNAANLP